MREIRIEKVTLNIGTGKDQARLEKGLLLLNNIAGLKSVKTFAKKRIPEWGIRLGLPIGCKVTLRKKKAEEILPRLFEARDKLFDKKQFDNNGNLSFGIPEYIDIPGVKYNPKIGILGLEVCVTLERPGFRIKKRRIKKSAIPTKHRITKDEAINFIKSKFNVNIKSGEE